MKSPFCGKRLRAVCNMPFRKFASVYIFTSLYKTTGKVYIQRPDLYRFVF